MNVIETESLSKKFKLGVLGGKTIRDDFSAWWAKIRGKENPLVKLGQESRLDEHGEFWALRDISFNVKPGEVVGIIGKNGAGKSTLLKILSRITYPTSGEIRIKGRMASLLEVGTGFHPELTGRENVFLNGAILGMNKKKVLTQLDEIIAFSGIEHHIDTPVKRYSSGMKVRLGFAVAAHLEPEILIIDEVLAVGDIEFQKKCLGKMNDVAKSGRTIIFVSHNMSAVRALCNRGILLNDGRVLWDGDVDSTISKYLGINEGFNSNLPSKAEFENKDNLSVFFSAIQIKSNSNSFIVEHSDNVIISFEFEIVQPIEPSYLFIVITDSLGNWIIATSNDDNGNNRINIDKLGSQRIEAIIPNLLLKPGVYYITCAIKSYTQNSNYIKHENVISFEIVDTRTIKGQRNLYRKPAIVAPQIIWNYF